MIEIFLAFLISSSVFIAMYGGYWLGKMKGKNRTDNPFNFSRFFKKSRLDDNIIRMNEELLSQLTVGISYMLDQCEKQNLQLPNLLQIQDLVRRSKSSLLQISAYLHTEPTNFDTNKNRRRLDSTDD